MASNKGTSGTARIAIEPLGGDIYRVTIDSHGSQTTHEVTVTAEHVMRYAAGADAERLLQASFQFLLQREPKESILSRFALPVIERYFPEYGSTIRGLLAASGGA